MIRTVGLHVQSLLELFPDSDFRLHLTLRKGEPQEFFRGWDESGRHLAERRHWLNSDPYTYAALSPEGEPIFAEFADLCRSWNLSDARVRSELPNDARPAERLRTLGQSLEPDLLFLSADHTGLFRLHGGALCFPTGWALRDKLGHTLEYIHGVVPGLNDALSSPINLFLSRLRPGAAFLRDNWGIAASDELNHHPVRGLPMPTAPIDLSRLWLRVEHQALIALPISRGIVFGIRISLHRLDDVVSDRSVASGLARALASMSEAMVAYKRLDAIRSSLIKQLTTA